MAYTFNPLLKEGFEKKQEDKPSVETWLYKNLTYTPSARLTLSHNNFNEVAFSSNLDLLESTSDTVHNVDRFIFEENDFIKISVNVKLDANVNANLLKFKIRSKDGNYPIRQVHSDTNVQQFGQVLVFDFTPFSVNAGTAANGFDITITDFNSTADAFIYNIVTTIQKIGTTI